jgi:zinc protease
LPEGIRWIETVEAETGKVVIPYQKYELDNGLTLILHEDHSDPLVHVDVTYHVGSAREEAGKSGFAHFFEHMMFEGTEHAADGVHSRLIEEAGGTMNGSTSTDRTNYYQTIPSNQLDTVLWLEADRMGFLLGAVSSEKFETQRETVKNERGQNYDNRPYGRLRERVGEAQFAQDHPYATLPIGYIEDLNRVNVNDLKAFFLRWYGPNNATLSIGGDIDVQKTLASISKYFAVIPRGPEVAMPEKPVVTLEEDRYISMEDNVHLPLIYMSIPTVYAHHPDEAPLDVLMEIIGTGKTSILYQSLVKNQLAVQAQAGHGCSELSCSFTLLALPHPASGKSLEDIETVLRQSLIEFEARGVKDDDLVKIKAKMEAGFVFGLQSVSGKTSKLAAYETLFNNPNMSEQDLKRYTQVSAEDVMRVYQKYIKNAHAVVMRIVPNGALASVSPKDNFQRPERNFDELAPRTDDTLALRTVKEDNFDRSQRPAVGAVPSVGIPDFWEEKLAQNIRVLGAKNDETPTTSLLIRIPGGHYYESIEQSGLASMTAGLMNESTSEHSTEEMSQALQKLGSSISVDSGSMYTSIFVSTLTKNLSPTLALLREKMFSPAFSEADFERVKKQVVESIKQSKKDPASLSRTAFSRLLYGETIAGYTGSGDEESLASMTREDVQKFYEAHFKPEDAKIIVVSDLDRASIMASLPSVLEGWKGKAPSLSLSLPEPEVKGTRIYLVNKDDATQSNIRIGKRSVLRDYTGEFYRLGLMNHALGSGSTARLHQNLREDKGYTYGAYSGFQGGKHGGNFVALSSVRADVTLESIKEFISELSRFHDSGPNADEIALMRSAINQEDALKYETPNAKLGFISKILEYNLPRDFVKQQAEIVSSITKAELDALAKKHLDLDEMFILVVGDAETLRPQLETLGFPVEDYEI